MAVNYARDEAAAREVVAEIERGGGAAVALQGDVSVEEDVMAMFEAPPAGSGRSAASSPTPASSRRPRG